jgi:hypothetical protein
MVTSPGITADTTLDLTVPATIVHPGTATASAEMRAVRFGVTDRKGQAIEGLEGRVWADQVQLDFAPAKGTTFEWSLPSCASYRAAFKAPGYTTILHQGVVKGQGDPIALKATMLRRAHVSLRGPITNVIVPGAIPEATDGAFEIDVAAGPLTLRVLRQGEPPLAIELVLAEGETRQLEVR